MAITSESQLIDVQTIYSGCNAFVSALEIFINGGNKIIEAGNTCSSKAISIDGKSLQPDIVEVGQQVGNLYNEFVNYAQAVSDQATQIYNQQVAELNEYRRQQAEQQNNG